MDVFGHWRIESAVEHTMGRHEARLEAKRQQLQSIRQAGERMWDSGLEV